MIKSQAVPDAAISLALRACRVQRVDSCNAVCMVHNPECLWATPYGNYCEHPFVGDVAEYHAAEDAERGRPFGG